MWGPDTAYNQWVEICEHDRWDRADGRADLG